MHACNRPLYSNVLATLTEVPVSVTYIVLMIVPLSVVAH